MRVKDLKEVCNEFVIIDVDSNFERHYVSKNSINRLFTEFNDYYIISIDTEWEDTNVLVQVSKDKNGYKRFI